MMICGKWMWTVLTTAFFLPVVAVAAPKNVRAAPPPVTGLEIAANGMNISGQTKTYYAGQRIDFLGTTTDGSPLTEPSWSLPNDGSEDDNPIFNWEANNTTAAITPINPYLHAQSISFYYVKGNGIRVIFTATVKGNEYSAFVTLNITRPTATISITTGSVFAVLMPDLLDRCMGFGDYDGLELEGVYFTAALTPVGFYGGSEQWVQIVDTCTALPNSTPGLDVRYPAYLGAVFLDSPQSRAIETAQFSRSDSFTTYLMWESPAANSIYVPLERVDWGWSGTAANVGEVWLLTAQGIVAPVVTDCTLEPQWTQNANPPPV